MQGYRDRYDIIDHGHEKKNFYRSIFTEIKEFATIVLWKLVINFGYRGRTVLQCKYHFLTSGATKL